MNPIPPNPRNKPFIVPVFIPHAGCPQRCVFCNQRSTTGQAQTLPSFRAIRKTISDFLAHRRDPGRFTEISFYGGNFLGLPPEQIELLLTTAAAFVRRGQANGLRFSTRPDTITPPRLKLLTDYPVTTIEIGAQSMNDAVLQRSQRGHSAEDTVRAVQLIKTTRSYAVGLQMMVGLPGDTAASTMATARQLATLAPDFVRIYPTVVLRGSALAQWHAKGEYDAMPLAEAVALTADLYQIFHRNDIPVIRMGLQAADELSPEADLIAGPYHPAFGELVQSKLWQDAICRHIENEDLLNAEVVLAFHPNLQSQIKGPSDSNIFEILQRCNLQTLELQTRESLPLDAVAVNGRLCRK